MFKEITRQKGRGSNSTPLHGISVFRCGKVGRQYLGITLGISLARRLGLASAQEHVCLFVGTGSDLGKIQVFKTTAGQGSHPARRTACGTYRLNINALTADAGGINLMVDPFTVEETELMDGKPNKISIVRVPKEFVTEQ